MYLFDSIEHSTHTKIRNGKEILTKSKKVLHHFKCNNCGKEFTRSKNGKMRETDTHFCSDCPHYSLAASKSSLSKHKKYVQKGYKTDRGYKEIYVGEKYPYRESKWIREHIVVMENHIGKRIPKGMVVHHIDGNKSNNNLENLLLCTVKEHNKCHAVIERLVFDLYQKGLVGFDKEKMEYYFKE
jgi:predicted RNA-binding Zn-ribbon protein involved in translation (DUF1610 family)